MDKVAAGRTPARAPEFLAVYKEECKGEEMIPIPRQDVVMGYLLGSAKQKPEQILMRVGNMHGRFWKLPQDSPGASSQVRPSGVGGTAVPRKRL